MHLYPCVYLYFYATILMKQYLISLYAHLLQNIRFFISIFHIPFILNAIVHSATLINCSIQMFMIFDRLRPYQKANDGEVLD